MSLVLTGLSLRVKPQKLSTEIVPRVPCFTNGSKGPNMLVAYYARVNAGIKMLLRTAPNIRLIYLVFTTRHQRSVGYCSRNETLLLRVLVIPCQFRYIVFVNYCMSWRQRTRTSKSGTLDVSSVRRRCRQFGIELQSLQLVVHPSVRLSIFPLSLFVLAVSAADMTPWPGGRDH